MQEQHVLDDDEQCVMRTLQRAYYMSVNESPDLPRTPSFEDIARLRRMQVKRKKSFELQKSDPRWQSSSMGIEKPHVRSSRGSVSLRGVAPSPCEVQLAKDDKDNSETHLVRGTRLRVVHQELTSRRPRENHRAPHIRPTSVPPEFRAITEEIKMFQKVNKTTGTHLHVASKLRTVHAELASFTWADREAALKVDRRETTRELRKSRRGKTGEITPPSRRVRSCLIPKTSPLARFKREWSSESLCSPDNSFCSSIDVVDAIDIDHLNRKSSWCSSDDASNTQSIEFPSIDETEIKSGENDDSKMSIEVKEMQGNSMDLSELAHSLSSLLATVNMKETFRPRSPLPAGRPTVKSATTA